VQKKGTRKANWYFALDVIKLFRPSIIRPNSSNKLNQYGMLGNHFKVGVRNLIKRKLFTFINIFGLAVGMAAALVLWKYVQFELNFDKYNINAHVLYRITNSIYSNDEQWHVSGYDLGPSLQSEIPEIILCMKTLWLATTPKLANLSYFEKQISSLWTHLFCASSLFSLYMVIF